MNTFFEIGEVVWGKIKGYPWWPAIITELRDNLIYTVKFYSDYSYGKLSPKFLLKYEENKNKIIEANKKNKKLLGAVKAAESDIKKHKNMNYMPIENDNINDMNVNDISKNKIDKEIKKLNFFNKNLEPKNLVKINNNDLKNNLINKTEIMANQNNRVNIFSIVKNNKNSNSLNNLNSPISSFKGGEESHLLSEKNNSNFESNSNNNDIIINKNLLILNNDDKINLLPLNNNNKENISNIEKEKGKKFKKLKKFKYQKKIKNDVKKEVENNKKEEEIKKEKYFIKIEIENLDTKINKKKEIKQKSKADEKAKEEKKRKEEEDHFIYQIDEYFFKIFNILNSKKYEQLDYQKEEFKKILIFLSKYKRDNFIEFLKMTNISKYIQYFLCHLKAYDAELDNLAKKVYRNFHKQFNKEFFSNQNIEL